MSLRVLTWNCHRASATHPLWTYFAELAPDIALLQEVTGMPPALLESYQIRTATPVTRVGRSQRFHSAILAREQIKERVELKSDLAWVDRELQRFSANLLAYRIALGGSSDAVAVCVHSPAWPLDRARLRGEDLGLVKLTQNVDVWVTDLLLAALRCRPIDGVDWIIAGDFNLCESFDQWQNGPRGNREWLDRMSAIGFTECLRDSQGPLTPTFRKPGATVPTAQVDHLFVTARLRDRLSVCTTGEPGRVFGSRLSDHLPVIADFTFVHGEVT